VSVDGNVVQTVDKPVTETAPTFTIDRSGAKTVSVSASVGTAGFTDTDPTNDGAGVVNVLHAPSLTGLTPGETTTGGDQAFTATLHRDGVTGPLTFALNGPNDLVLTPPGQAEGPVSFTVHSDLRDRGPAPFGITVAAAGWSVLDNSASSTYIYATTPPPAADVSVSSSQNMNGQSGTGKVSARVSAPTGVGAVLRVTFDPDKVTLTGPADCTPSTGGITCPLSGGEVLKTFDVDLVDRTGNVSRSATIGFAVTVASPYVDPASVNNTASETVTRR
jgi:hypothetical protein